MNSIAVGLTSIVCMFGGTLVGLWLKGRLPRHHLNAESHDIVKLASGTIATLAALVLGLLVSTAKSLLDSMNSGIMEASANIVLLDRQLARYGPDARVVRDELRRVVAFSIEMVCPAEEPSVSGFAAFEWSNEMESVERKLSELTPQDENQRRLFGQAAQIAFDLSHTRWTLVAHAQLQLPTPLLVVLISWLSILFVTFGLFAPRNPTVIAVLFMGACSAAAAIFLVLEMNQPLRGLVRLSVAPLRNALQHLGR